MLEKRYTSILEISRLTRELEDALGRDDRASSLLTLQARADEMAKADGYMEELWRMAESDAGHLQKLRSLLGTDPSLAVEAGEEEEAILALRRKMCLTVEGLQAADKRLSRRVAGLKSYYETTT
ncbi:MAG: hypothetical protein LIP16_05650 [Clostridium sp.]|nr:hypothetical protein [Clostridium sp.]